MLKYGTDINLQDGDDSDPLSSRDTPLHWAIAFRQIGFVRFLIEHDVDVNLINNSSTTPLIMAVSYEATEIVEILLENKADGSVKDQNSMTALDWAMDFGLGDLARMLAKAEEVRTCQSG